MLSSSLKFLLVSQNNEIAAGMIFMKYLILSLLFVFFSLDGLRGQAAYEEVVAQEGDGIFTLLRSHGLVPSQHLQAFLELNKDNLGKDNSLYKGRVYKLPVADTTVVVETDDAEEVIPEAVALQRKNWRQIPKKAAP